MVGLLVLVGPAARPAGAATPVPSADAGFLSLLNGLRSSLGLGALAADPQLSGVARSWSATMASSGTLAHNGALSSQVGPVWTKLGENVGMGSSAAQIFDALVASPAHLRNMADPAFSLVGIGSVADASGRLWTTHVFLQPRGARAAAAPTPAPPRPAPAAAPATTRVPKPAPSTTAAPLPVAPAPTTAAPVTTAAPAPPATLPPDPVTAATDGSSSGPTAPPSAPETGPGTAPETGPLRLASGQQRSVAGSVAAGALLVVLVLLAASGSAGLLLPRRPPGSGGGRGPR